jgi:hypothetical protein
MVRKLKMENQESMWSLQSWWILESWRILEKIAKKKLWPLQKSHDHYGTLHQQQKNAHRGRSPAISGAGEVKAADMGTSASSGMSQGKKAITLQHIVANWHAVFTGRRGGAGKVMFSNLH